MKKIVLSTVAAVGLLSVTATATTFDGTKATKDSGGQTDSVTAMTTDQHLKRALTLHAEKHGFKVKDDDENLDGKNLKSMAPLEDNHATMQKNNNVQIFAAGSSGQLTIALAV